MGILRNFFKVQNSKKIRRDNDLEIYESLPLEYFDSVRVLILKAGQTNDLLEGRLQCMRLSDIRSKYSALSYTWDQQDSRTYVKVNGNKVWLRKNLFEFLVNVRKADEDVWIWADAICIDQREDAQKSHQVKLMGHIYSYSKETLAWLGGDMTDAQALLSLQEIGPRIWDDYLSLNHVSECATQLDHETFQEALTHVCTKPYWTRAWIMQELILARSVVICCADQKVKWEQIGYIFDHSLPRDDMTSRALDTSGIAHIIHDRRTHQLGNVGRGLADLLRFYFLKGCTIPRDRIFSLISLISYPGDPLFNIIPNDSGLVRSSKEVQSVIDYQKAPELLFLEIIKLYPPMILLDFAMQLLEALNIYEVPIDHSEDFGNGYAVARLSLLDTMAAFNWKLYAFGNRYRKKWNKDMSGVSNFALEDTVLIVDCDSGKVEGIKNIFFTKSGNEIVYLNLTEVLHIDPHDVERLVQPIKEAFVDCSTDLLKLSIPLMVALSRLSRYLKIYTRDVEYVGEFPRNLDAWQGTWWE